MTLEQVLAEVKDRGLRLVLSRSGPRLQGRTSEATPALIGALGVYKQQIVERLRAEAKLGEPVDWDGGRLVHLKEVGWVVEGDLGPCRTCSNGRFVVVASGSQRRLVCGQCVRLAPHERPLGIIHCTEKANGKVQEAAGHVPSRPA